MSESNCTYLSNKCTLSRTKKQDVFIRIDSYLETTVYCLNFFEERICNTCNVLWTVAQLLYVIFYFCKLISCHQYLSHIIYCALCMATVLNVKATNCFLNYKKCILSHCRITKTPNIKAGFHILLFTFFCFLVIAWNTWELRKQHSPIMILTFSKNVKNIFVYLYSVENHIRRICCICWKAR